MLHGDVGPHEGVEKGCAGDVIEDCYADELGLAVKGCAHFAVDGDGEGFGEASRRGGLDLETGGESWGDCCGKAVGGS